VLLPHFRYMVNFEILKSFTDLKRDLYPCIVQKSPRKAGESWIEQGVPAASSCVFPLHCCMFVIGEHMIVFIPLLSFYSTAVC